MSDQPATPLTEPSGTTRKGYAKDDDELPVIEATFHPAYVGPIPEQRRA